MLCRIIGGRLMKLNSIRFISQEEVNAMAQADLEVTKTTFGKANEVKRDSYSIEVKLDRLTSHKLPISKDDFVLLHYFSERKNLADQFVVACRARIIETQWPEKDSRPAHSSYLLQIYVNEDLKWEEDFSYLQFRNVYLKGIKNGGLKEFLPVIRIPGIQEKEVDLEEPKEEDASDNPEKVPF